MQHSLSNLLANALKYSGADSHVHLHLEDAENGVVISVEDRGIGIPESDIQHLFEPFHRASNVGNVPGSGLGLTIVQEFVSMHGGTIEVQSAEGHGTTMTMFIPADQTNWSSHVHRDEDRDLRTTSVPEGKEHSRSYLIQHPTADNGRTS
jgi:signal transduction histidine kinase